MTELIVIFAGVATALLIAGYLVVQVAGRQRRVQARLEKIGERARPLTVEEQRIRQLKRKTAEASPFLEGIAGRLMPNPDAVRARLHRTGKRISLGQYFAASLGLGIVSAFLLWAMLPVPLVIIVTLGVIIGVGVPHILIGFLVQRRRKKFTALFPDAIDLMVRGLRSGLPVTETIAACGREMSDPVGVEFRAIADAVRLGQTLEDALWDAANRLDTPEFKFFVISLSVQKETGGNLAETLANLSDILRSRKQMRLKITAMSSEAKASAFILGSLPFIMFVLIYFLNPEYEEVLFTDPRGRLMLGGGIGLMALGGLVMHKMIRFEI